MKPVFNIWNAKLQKQQEIKKFSGKQFQISKTINNIYKVDQNKKIKSLCHFNNINKEFDNIEFQKPRQKPYIIGQIQDVDQFQKPISQQYYDQKMIIKYPGTEYRIPSELQSMTKEAINKVSDFYKSESQYHDKMYTYLTVSRGPCYPFQSQRRPGLHADGVKKYARHEKGDINNTIFLIANAICPIFYNESFDIKNLNPKKDDLYLHFSKMCKKPYDDSIKPYQIAMLDGYSLHSVSVNKSFDIIDRVFIRIMYSQKLYNKNGNLNNPLFPEYN